MVMVLKGKAAAPGVAVGNIFVYKKDFNIPKEMFISKGEEQAHIDRYQSVKKLAFDELEDIRLVMEKNNPNEANIFKAHQEIIEDIIINEEIPSRIKNDLWTGEWAIYQVYETVLTVLKQTPDPLISERAADFDDARSLLLRLWQQDINAGRPKKLSDLKQPVIIAARDLAPSDTASMNREKVLAILTEAGGVTSHTAIIAKSYEIPTVMGIQGLLETVKDGQFAAVNAYEGSLFLDPEKEIVKELEKKSAYLHKDKKKTQSFLNKEGATSCGQKIDIGLNITDTDGDSLSGSNYSDFVGLFRTEFLYMGRAALPSEEEQYLSYKKVLENFSQKTVVLRSLDIGGDKKITGINMPQEENPFLGNRALRLCFSNPEIFKTQIRAVLRASVFGDLWFMLPMVTSVEDIHRAKKIIASVMEDMKKEGKVSFSQNSQANACVSSFEKGFGKIKIGIMVEVPSIALVAEHVVKEVDFASIGTNDLCQYLCAADRLNSAVEPYYQSYHPSVFKVIYETSKAFNKMGRPLSVCGELASDPKAAVILVGLGLRKLSMNASSIAAVKRALSCITLKECEELASKVLGCATAAQVEELITFNNRSLQLK